MHDNDAVRETRLEAAKNGRRKFLTKPCPQCGCELRYTVSGQCTDCARRRSTQRHNKIRDILREASE